MNLLIFHLHDMGRYCSPYGYPARTPHMQAFAERATLFRNAHSAAPTCSPSRAALLTGQTAHQAGMLGLLHRGFDLKDYSQHLGSFLGRNGYETAYAGVQHEFHPDSDQDVPYQRKLVPSREEGTRDQQAAMATAEFLDEAGKKPFFLWTGMIYPHRPFLKADPSKYNPNHIQPPAPLPDTPETRQDMADYFESVEHADACFGTVMEALDRNGLREQTIVILTTDHGIAFPEMKCNLTAHGTGVALVMDYPGNPMRGRACDALVSHINVFPSLCELLELERPEYLIGESLVPLFKGETESVRADAFAEVNYHAGRQVMRSVRTNRYNYVRILDPDPNVALVNIDPGHSKDVLIQHGLGNDTARDRLQLYDLAFDPQERRNLAGDPAYLNARLEMEKRLQHWMVLTDDPAFRGPVEAPAGAVVDPRSQRDPG
ncbi:MAG: sulfatase family protein [Oceanipulchritudo sp.]